MKEIPKIKNYSKEDLKNAIEFFELHATGAKQSNGTVTANNVEILEDKNLVTADILLAYQEDNRKTEIQHPNIEYPLDLLINIMHGQNNGMF